MKSKSVILAFVLILMCAVSAVAASGDGSIGGHTFTIPDGYSIYNSSDDTVSLEKDEYHAITIIFGDSGDLDEAKSNLASKGYAYVGGDSYQYGDFDVVQQNYEYKNIIIYAYACTSDDVNLIITLTALSSEPALEGSDNPVTTILDTVK